MSARESTSFSLPQRAHRKKGTSATTVLRHLWPKRSRQSHSRDFMTEGLWALLGRYCN